MIQVLLFRSIQPQGNCCAGAYPGGTFRAPALQQTGPMGEFFTQQCTAGPRLAFRCPRSGLRLILPFRLIRHAFPLRNEEKLRPARRIAPPIVALRPL
jgi:hypothetical protein